MKRVIGKLVCMAVAVALVMVATGCSKQGKKKRALAKAEQDFAAERYDRAEIGYLAALRVPPLDPAALLKLGRISYVQGRYPQAHAFLQKAVELQPDNADARARFAMASLALSKPKEAREQALLCLDKQPSNFDALLALVEGTTSTNEVPETLKRLEAVPGAGKARADYRVARGSLHLRMREWEQAESEFKAALAADPKSSQAFLGLGNIYLTRTNLVEAEKAFKAAAEVAPPRSVARLRYADLKLKTGAGEVARKIVEEVTIKTPDYIPAWIFLAQMAFTEQNTEASGKLIDKVLARDPVNLEALMLKGNLFLSKADPTNAIIQFERIRTTYGRVPPAQFRLALAQLQNRETAKAMGTLNDLLAREPRFADAVLLKANLQLRDGDSASAVTALSTLLKDQPRLFVGYLLLSKAYLAQRNTEAAVAVYQHMAGLFPKAPEVQLMLGSLYVQQNKSADARKAFEKALEIVPDYPAAEEKLFDMDLAARDYAAAAERARRQLEAKPTAAEPWLFLAKVHLAQAFEHAGITNNEVLPDDFKSRVAQSQSAQSELRETETCLLKAIELNPQLTMPYLILAQVYVRTGRQQEALDRLAVPAKAKNVGALMQIGTIHSEQKNYKAARDAYEAILGINPQASPAMNNLAFLYCEHLGDPAKAYAMAQKARELLPQDPRTADTLGWVLYRRGDYDRAVVLLEEAALKMELDPEVQFHLGMAHYMAGEEGPARVALERAVQSGKEFSGKEEARKRLEVLSLEVSGMQAAKLAELRQRAAKEPDDVVLLLRLAEAHERDGQFAEARDAYQTVLKRSPRNGRVQLKLIRLYSDELEQPAKAMDLAKSAHAALPEDAEVTAVLGRLALEQAEHEWALSLLQEAARKLPDRPELMYDLALAYYSVGKVTEAEGTMQKASGLSPFVHQEEAKTFLKLVKLAGEPAGVREAVAGARALIQKQPNYVPALLVVGMAEEQEGNFKGAGSTYEKVLASYPRFTPAMKKLALVYALHLGENQKAYDLAMKAREALPKDWELARTLGILSYRRAEYERALQYLDQSLREQADDAEAQFYKGMAHSNMKQRAESTKALQRALALKLDPKLEQEAKKALEEKDKG